MAIDAVFPACERARDALRGRGRRGRLRLGARRHRSSARTSAPASARSSSWRSPGTLGYLVGALIGWGIGRYGGRPLLERHGRWFHLSPAQARPGRGVVRPLGEPRRRCSAGSRRSSARSSRSRPASSRCRSRRTPCSRSSARRSGRSPSPGPATGSAPATSGFDHGFHYVEYAVVAGVVARRGVFGLPMEAAAKVVAVQTIPLVDVSAEYEPLIPQARGRASARCSTDGQFIRGPNY